MAFSLFLSCSRYLSNIESIYYQNICTLNEMNMVTHCSILTKFVALNFSFDNENVAKPKEFFQGFRKLIFKSCIAGIFQCTIARRQRATERVSFKCIYHSYGVSAIYWYVAEKIISINSWWKFKSWYLIQVV